MTAFLARTDLLQLAIVEVLSQICPTQWAYGEPTEDALPDSLLTLTWSSSDQTQTHQRAASIYTVENFTLEVDSSEVGRGLGVVLNGTPYVVTATDADPETLRDLLLAEIVADAEAPYQATAIGSVGLEVEPTQSGSLLSVSILSGSDLVTTEIGYASQPHLVTRTTNDVTIQLQAWAASIAPRSSAAMLLAHAQQLLQGPLATLTLRARGCVVRSWDRAIDLTAIAGAAWASRAAVDFVIAYETQLVEPATRIQSTPVLLEITT